MSLIIIGSSGSVHVFSHLIWYNVLKVINSNGSSIIVSYIVRYIFLYWYELFFKKIITILCHLWQTKIVLLYSY